MPHIEEWVEPLMVVPALYSRCSRWYQMSQTFPDVPGGSRTALVVPRVVWMKRDVSGGVWTCLGSSRLFEGRLRLAGQS